jgi:hypothetical protein
MHTKKKKKFILHRTLYHRSKHQTRPGWKRLETKQNNIVPTENKWQRENLCEQLGLDYLL